MSQILFNLWSRLAYFAADFKYYLVFLFVILISGLGLLIWGRTKLVLSLVASLYTLVAIFALGEIYYRYVFDATDNVYHIKTTRRWIDRHVQWNASGVRDDHFFDARDPRETRIAFIGDSYTFGYGIKNVQNRYVELLGEKLRSQCSPEKTLKTYNFGLPGNQSRTYLNQLPNVLRYHPSAIVMEYYLDDIDGDKTPELTSPLEKVIYGYKDKPIIGFLLKRSFALEYWYIRLASLLSARHDWGQLINYNENLYRNPQVWQAHLSTLQGIIASTRGGTKVPLVVFIIPLSHRLGPNYPLTDIHKQLVQYFTSLDVPVLDMLPILNQFKPQQIMVSRYDYHLNEFGHKLIADNLYNFIKEIPGFQCR